MFKYKIILFYLQVIQRRFDGIIDFFRNWKDYKYGFGNKIDEYWFGRVIYFIVIESDLLKGFKNV